MIKGIVWSIISIIGAVAFYTVLYPSGQLNALWIVIAAACFFMVSYRFYASFIAARVISIDPARQTPANVVCDGMDYHPTNRWVLFGHHFAAIAGAGPLIGPMLAAQFGYLPGFLWILIGAALGGAVHDMVILAASVHRNGRSLPIIVRDEVGRVSGAASMFAVLFIIIVALAGLGLAVINALANNSWGTSTIGLTIPIALSIGLYLYKIRPGRVGEASVIGGFLLIAAVIAGHNISVSGFGHYLNLSKNGLILSIALYGLIASILPVWMLLCPRDYISSYLKIGTIFLLTVGVIIISPKLRMPALTQFIDGGGPVIPGKVFPFMFITIACGAVSGFHSLVSSGTTPKMISSERDIVPIGYGAMILEGFVAVIALIAASIIAPGDYFAINTKLDAASIAGLGFHVERIKELSALVGVDIAGRPGGAVSLAVGMSTILSSIPGFKGLMAYWYNFAIMFEALFILTTIDTGTRVARYLLQELGGTVFKGDNLLTGSFVTSLAVVSMWSYLIYSGDVSTIWPMFGVANQLLAAIALGAGSILIIKSGRVRYLWVTFMPMVFMYVTTLTASWILIRGFIEKSFNVDKLSEVFILRLDAALVALMALLAVVTLADMIHKARVQRGLSPLAVKRRVCDPLREFEGV